MKHIERILLAAALIFTAQATMTLRAQAQVLSGDTRLACEALLCLSAGANAPSECSAALAKYAALKAKTALQTAINQKNFLKLCPKQ